MSLPVLALPATVHEYSHKKTLQRQTQPNITSAKGTPLDYRMRVLLRTVSTKTDRLICVFVQLA